MLATYKTVLFPGHYHLPTTATDDPSLAGTWPIIKVPGHQYWWLAGGYDLEIRHFLEAASMVVTWWIVAFSCSGKLAYTLIFIHDLSVPADKP